MTPVRRWRAALALSLAGILAGSARLAHADDAAAVRKELQAIADQMDEAYRKKDARLYASFSVPAQREADESRWRRNFERLGAVESSRTRVGEVTLHDGEAVASMATHQVLAREWRGVTYRREYRNSWQQSWLKTPEGWRQRTSLGETGEIRSLGNAEEQFWKSLPGPPAAEAERKRIRHELQAIYDRRSRAFLKGDAAAAVADLAPEWEALSASGLLIKRADNEKNILQAFKTGHLEQMSWRIEEVTAAGQGAIARVRRIRVHIGPGPDGKSRKTTEEMVSLDRWRREGDRWKVVASDQDQASFRIESTGKDAGGDQKDAQSSAGAPQQMPSGWLLSGARAEAYKVSTDRLVKHSGNASASLRRTAPGVDGSGALKQMFKADALRGQRVRLSGYVRSRGVTDWAGLWMRVDAGEKILAFDNMEDRPIKGSTDWKEYAIVLDVPENAVVVHFGVVLAGGGQVWVDDLRFGVVGPEVASTVLKVALPEPSEEVRKHRLKEQAAVKSMHPVNLGFEK